MTRHIGGSILPSGNTQVFQTKSGPFGVLQVRALPELNTHAVFFARTTADLGTEETQIASHPNGFSCEVLAVRTIDAWEKGYTQWAVDQANYILTCGGTVIEQDRFSALLTGEIDRLFDAAPAPAF